MLPPGLSAIWLTWFHPDGPYADWRGSDEIMETLHQELGVGDRAAPS